MGFIVASYAQDANHFPTKKIDGIEYYIYTVQAGEGLYSISKRFNVSQSEINNVNPQIQDGLKAGQEIFIPKKGQIKTQNSEIELSKTEYIIHKVQKKQTLFAISRIYNVSQEEIVAANPEAANGVRMGDELKIPQKSKEDSDTKKSKKETKEEKQKKDSAKETDRRDENTTKKPEQKPDNSTNTPNLHIGNDGNFIFYQVQPGETLYSISKRYNTTVDEIIKHNPEIANSLPTGTKLKIPFNTKTSETTTTREVEKKGRKDTYKIAYLLPLMLDEKGKDATVRKFLDFYMGSLLAVKNAQNSGTNYDIYTFDTEKSETKIHSIINLPEMGKMDLIIGPAYSAQTPILTDFAKRREIYTVVPFSSNVENIEDNPYIFQFNPDKELQSHFMVNVLKKDFLDANIVIADIDNNQTSEEKDFFNIIKDKLYRSNIEYVKVTKADLVNNKMDYFLVNGKKNIVIFNTYDFLEVESNLAYLYDINQKYDVAVMGQYAWKDVSGKKPKMYYVAPFKDDEQRLANAATMYESEFTQYYGKLRGEKNPRYDMIGYDITNYFLSLINENKLEVEETTRNMKGEGIQTDMFFRRVNKNGGFMNQKLFLIEDAAKRK